ncbi:MAG: hypothetical protein U0Y82_11520 [Thermoleophilia bacterium]
MSTSAYPIRLASPPQRARAPRRCTLCHERSTAMGDSFCRMCREQLVADFVRWLKSIDALGSLRAWNAPWYREEHPQEEVADQHRGGMHSWRDRDEDDRHHR